MIIGNSKCFSFFSRKISFVDIQIVPQRESVLLFECFSFDRDFKPEVDFKSAVICQTHFQRYVKFWHILVSRSMI